jgi:uncharacterized protein (TIRG00374 family)
VKKRSKIALRLLFACLVFALLSFFIDFEKFVREIQNVSIAVICICVLSELLFYVIESVKLLFLGGFKYRLSPILHSRFLSAFLANFGPGMAVGDVLRVFILDRYRPGNKVYVATLLASGRIYGILPLAVILPMFALTNPILKEKIGFSLLLIACFVGLLAWSSPLFLNSRLFRQMFLKSYQLIGVVSLRRLIRKIYLSLRSFCSLKNWIVGSTTSLVTTLLVVFEFWLLSASLGLDVQFSEWALLVSIISVITFLPVGIGAIGSQDAALALLAPYFGQSVESFVAISVLMHVIRVVGTLPGLLFLGEGIGVIRKIRIETKQGVRIS